MEFTTTSYWVTQWLLTRSPSAAFSFGAVLAFKREVSSHPVILKPAAKAARGQVWLTMLASVFCLALVVAGAERLRSRGASVREHLVAPVLRRAVDFTGVFVTQVISCLVSESL